MVAPGGVPNLYEDVRPKNIPPTPIMMLNKIAALNPFTIRIAMAAGSTISADTSNAPIIGIITEMVRPVNMLKDKESHFVESPLVKAVSSSNVSTYRGR